MANNRQRNSIIKKGKRLFKELSKSNLFKQNKKQKEQSKECTMSREPNPEETIENKECSFSSPTSLNSFEQPPLGLENPNLEEIALETPKNDKSLGETADVLAAGIEPASKPLTQAANTENKKQGRKLFNVSSLFKKNIINVKQAGSKDKVNDDSCKIIKPLTLDRSVSNNPSDVIATIRSYGSLPVEIKHSKNAFKRHLSASAARIEHMGHALKTTSKKSFEISKNSLTYMGKKLQDNAKSVKQKTAFLKDMKKRKSAQQKLNTEEGALAVVGAYPPMHFSAYAQPLYSGIGIARYSSYQEQKSVPSKSQSALWGEVKPEQLKALYAAVQLSFATSTLEKLMWVEILLNLINEHSNRCDIDDPVRAAALDGGGVLAALNTLASQNMNQKASTMFGTENENTQSHDDKISSSNIEETLKLSFATFQLLQELCLNDTGSQYFHYYAGANIVMQHINNLKLIEQLPCRHTLKESEMPEKVLPRVMNSLELQCLKAMYRLILATSTSSESDCSAMWLLHGAANYPVATLNDECSKDPIYAGLALSVLRVLSTRQTVLVDAATQYSSISLSQMQQHPENCWVIENALAVLSVTQSKQPEVTRRLNQIKTFNPWQLIMETCRNFKNEGHVLYQGFSALKHGCTADKNLSNHLMQSLDLINPLLPKHNDIYFETLIPVAIGLKHLLQPFDFENNEVQNYLRMKNFEFVYAKEERSEVTEQGFKLTNSSNELENTKETETDWLKKHSMFAKELERPEAAEESVTIKAAQEASTVEPFLNQTETGPPFLAEKTPTDLSANCDTAIGDRTDTDPHCSTFRSNYSANFGQENSQNSNTKLNSVHELQEADIAAT